MVSIIIQFGLMVCSVVATPQGYTVDSACEIPSVSRVEITVDDGVGSCPLYKEGTLVDGKVMVSE